MLNEPYKRDHKMPFKDRKLQEQFDNILDTFTGADGGVKFVYLRLMLEELERRSDESNDPHAEQLLAIIGQFSRMIDVASMVT
jgi:hypothetical protein